MSLVLENSQARFDGGVVTVGTQLPSGQRVELFDVLVDTVGEEAWLRFRFLAPEISRDQSGSSFEVAQLDFEHLCSEVALPYLGEFDLEADVIVLSLLDRPVAFGEVDPDATQLIEAFRLRDGQCEWEGLW